MVAQFVVHRCNYYKPSLGAVNCLAYDANSLKVAVLRATKFDKSLCSYVIEIWDASQLPAISLCQRIAEPIGSCIECICFCNGRLFSANRDGLMAEYSLKYLRQLTKKQVSASPLWCISSHENSSKLAAGSDEGSIYILDVLKTDFEIVKLIKTSLDGRLLCLDWTWDGDKLVGGSSNCMQIWDATTGITIRTINVAFKSAKVGTIIWCIQITDDFTIISGDSRGVVSFWDGHTGTLISEHEMHEADVLAVAYDKISGIVMASGIDPKLQLFAPFSKKKVARIEDGLVENREWNPTFVRRIHTHDVRALTAMDKSYFLSAGLDGALSATHFDGRNSKYYPHFQDNIKIASQAHTLLLQYTTSIQLWKLAKGASVDSVDQFAKASADFFLEIRSKANRSIVCSAIHTNGQLVAYSDGIKTHFLRIAPGDGVTTAKRIKVDGLQDFQSRVIGFNLSSDNEWAIICDSFGRVERLGLEGVEGNVQCDVQLAEQYGVVTGVDLNHDQSLLALSTSTRHVLILDPNNLEVKVTLPHLVKSPISLCSSATGRPT